MHADLCRVRAAGLDFLPRVWGACRRVCFLQASVKWLGASSRVYGTYRTIECALTDVHCNVQ